ncbi:uncharacterized protein IL334_007971 [Kwoniella shivajii]|uniref:Uncharacterized protein n=1 Tax=Kwoniella shivajii TaxID=564305 RepID=A0ABZ1DA56_9TREE|nr:hypothetical protein IL334_007971 [Kwoniella shivajii]
MSHPKTKRSRDIRSHSPGELSSVKTGESSARPSKITKVDNAPNIRSVRIIKAQDLPDCCNISKLRILKQSIPHEWIKEGFSIDPKHVDVTAPYPVPEQSVSARVYDFLDPSLTSPVLWPTNSEYFPFLKPIDMLTERLKNCVQRLTYSPFGYSQDYQGNPVQMSYLDPEGIMKLPSSISLDVRSKGKGKEKPVGPMYLPPFAYDTLPPKYIPSIKEWVVPTGPCLPCILSKKKCLWNLTFRNKVTGEDEKWNNAKLYLRFKSNKPGYMNRETPKDYGDLIWVDSSQAIIRPDSSKLIVTSTTTTHLPETKQSSETRVSIPKTDRPLPDKEDVVPPDEYPSNKGHSTVNPATTTTSSTPPLISNHDPTTYLTPQESGYEDVPYETTYDDESVIDDSIPDPGHYTSHERTHTAGVLDDFSDDEHFPFEETGVVIKDRGVDISPEDAGVSVPTSGSSFLLPLQSSSKSTEGEDGSNNSVPEDTTQFNSDDRTRKYDIRSAASSEEARPYVTFTSPRVWKRPLERESQTELGITTVIIPESIENSDPGDYLRVVAGVMLDEAAKENEPLPSASTTFAEPTHTGTTPQITKKVKSEEIHILYNLITGTATSFGGGARLLLESNEINAFTTAYRALQVVYQTEFTKVTELAKAGEPPFSAKKGQKRECQKIVGPSGQYVEDSGSSISISASFLSSRSIASASTPHRAKSPLVTMSSGITSSADQQKVKKYRRGDSTDAAVAAINLKFVTFWICGSTYLKDHPSDRREPIENMREYIKTSLLPKASSYSDSVGLSSEWGEHKITTIKGLQELIIHICWSSGLL